MKKHLFASLLLLIVCVPALSGNTDTLSVMSYNLRFGELASMKDRLAVTFITTTKYIS